MAQGWANHIDPRKRGTQRVLLVITKFGVDLGEPYRAPSEHPTYLL